MFPSAPTLLDAGPGASSSGPGFKLKAAACGMLRNGKRNSDRDCARGNPTENPTPKSDQEYTLCI